MVPPLSSVAGLTVFSVHFTDPSVLFAYPKPVLFKDERCGFPLPRGGARAAMNTRARKLSLQLKSSREYRSRCSSSGICPGS